VSLKRIGASLALGLLAVVASAQDRCVLSNWRAARISHFDKLALGGPVPEYPEEARRRRWAGTVRIGVIVDGEGKVVKACPMFSPGRPMPHRLLVAAATAAAKQWRFKANFGFEAGVHPTFRYVQHELDFRFQLIGQHGDVRVGRGRTELVDRAGFASSATEFIAWFSERLPNEQARGATVSNADGPTVPKVNLASVGRQNRKITRRGGLVENFAPAGQHPGAMVIAIVPAARFNGSAREQAKASCVPRWIAAKGFFASPQSFGHESCTAVLPARKCTCEVINSHSG